MYRTRAALSLAFVALLGAHAACTRETRPADSCGLMFMAPYSNVPMKILALPGAERGSALGDIVYEATPARVWIAAADLGFVYVVDARTLTAARVDGFAVAGTNEATSRAKLGPNALAVGEGVVYVANPAGSEICAVDSASLKIRGCTKTASPPGEIAYDAARKQVWVSSPSTASVFVLDVRAPDVLVRTATIAVGGVAVGHAIEEERFHRFVTHVIDTGKTIVIDTETHAIVSKTEMCTTRGTGAFDDLVAVKGDVAVACERRIQGGALDPQAPGNVISYATHGGRGRIDYVASRDLFYVVGGSRLSVTQHGEDVFVAPLPKGARSVVADADAKAYVLDPEGGRVLVFDVIHKNFFCTYGLAKLDCGPQASVLQR